MKAYEFQYLGNTHTVEAETLESASHIWRDTLAQLKQQERPIRKYRMIDAPGWAHTTKNVARVYAYYATSKEAMAAWHRGGGADSVLIQECLSGEFDDQAEVFADWAHAGGIAAGCFRNLKTR